MKKRTLAVWVLMITLCSSVWAAETESPVVKEGTVKKEKSAKLERKKVSVTHKKTKKKHKEKSVDASAKEEKSSISQQTETK